MGWLVVLVLAIGIAVVVGILSDKERKGTKKHADELYISIREKELERTKKAGGRGKDAKEAKAFLNELDKINSFVELVMDNPDDYPDIKGGELLDDWWRYLYAIFWVKEADASFDRDEEYTRGRVLEMQERKARLLRILLENKEDDDESNEYEE